MIFMHKKYLFRDRYMYIMVKNLVYVHKCTKKFFLTVYQERLVFYYFKNNIKRYPKKGRVHIIQELPGPLGGPWTLAK